MKEQEKKCLVCGGTVNEVPLTKFDYKEQHFWICPQHIPVLIHSPHKLADLLPGADKFDAAPH